MKNRRAVWNVFCERDASVFLDSPVCSTVRHDQDRRLFSKCRVDSAKRSMHESFVWFGSFVILALLPAIEPGPFRLPFKYSPGGLLQIVDDDYGKGKS